MATIHLQPPEKFDFSKPDSWSHWKRLFKQFRATTGLDGESQGKQINTLLYCLGERAEEVLLSTGITEEQRQHYNAVMENLDNHFKVRRNIIFERARFNKRSQLEGETAEQFIMELQSLVEHCEYGDLRDDMVRDRLVVGIRDGTLSERLQLDSKLTLESAMKQTRQREAVHEGRLALKGGDQSLKEVDAVGKRRLAAAKPTPSLD